MTITKRTLSEADVDPSAATEAALSFWMPIVYTWVTFATICTIVNVVSLIFLFWFGNKPIVAMSQPSMLAVMCVGALLLIVGTSLGQINLLMGTAFPYFDDWNLDVLCKISFWLCPLGDFMMELIIFLKLYRVHKVMRFRRNQTVLPRHMIVPFLVCLIVPLLFATLLTLLEPGVVYDETLGHEVCNASSSVYFILYVVASFFILRVALLVFAWKLRHVKESVGDTRAIFRFEAFLFLLAIFAYTLLYAILPKIAEAMGYPAGLTIFWTVAVLPFFLQSLAPTIFLVLPRMYLVWYERVHGRLPDYVQLYGAGRVQVSMTSGTSRMTSGTSRMARSSLMASIELASTHYRVSAPPITGTVSDAETENENIAVNGKDGKDGVSGSDTNNSGHDATDDRCDEKNGGTGKDESV